MNILHINPYSQNKLWDNLYEYQGKSEDINVDIYVPLNRKYAKTIDVDYNTTYDKRYRFIFGDIDRFFFFHKNRKIIKDIEREYDIGKFDVLHAHTLFSSGFIAYELYKKYKVPYIVTLQNTDVNFFLKKIKVLNRIAKKIILNAEKVIFIGEKYKDYVVEKYFQEEILPETKIEIIPYGIDDFWFDNIYCDNKKNRQDDRIRILTVGMIDKNKNQQFICKICNELITKGINVEYSIVGDIINRSVFKHLVKNQYVKYLGFKSKEELKDIYRENDIFILLSKNETFGLVYAEAMSQGLPVIYTRGQGFDGNFEDGVVGKAVDIHSVKNGAESILYVLENYSDISRNLESSVMKFKWNIIADRYIKIYREIYSAFNNKDWYKI